MKKKFWGPKFGAKGSKSGLKLGFFCQFLRFDSLVFLEIAYKDSLQQCITSSRGKTHKKIFGMKFASKQAKIRPQIRFFAISKLDFFPN